MATFLYTSGTNQLQWIDPLREAFRGLTPRVEMFVAEVNPGKSIREFQFNLRKTEFYSQLLLYVVPNEPDMQHLELVIGFARMCSARLAILGTKPLNDAFWQTALPVIEGLAGYYVAAGLPETASLDAAQRLVSVLESAWYGRYEWAKEELKAVSRKYGNASLDRQ